MTFMKIYTNCCCRSIDVSATIKQSMSDNKFAWNDIASMKVDNCNGMIDITLLDGRTFKNVRAIEGQQEQSEWLYITPKK